MSMSSMYTTPGRNIVSSRIPEYLENLKNEYESLAHDVNMYKMQRDDFERKLQAQLGELNNIQSTLYELERNHNKIKQQYEEEILRLRRQLESGGNNNGSIRAPKPEKAKESKDTFYGGLAPIDSSRIHGPGKRSLDSDFIGTPPQHTSSFPPLMVQETSTPPSKHVKIETKISDSERKHTIDNSNKDDRGDDAGGGADWIVGYNPGVETNLNIDLMHNLDHSSVVCCVKFSNDGKYLATGCNKSAQIYDIHTGEKVHTFSEDPGKDGDLYIRSVCFSPDGRYLAAGAEDKTVKIWDIEQKQIRHTCAGHELDIYSLDYSKDGNFIISGSGDKKARIWDVEKGQCLFVLGNDEVGPKDGVTSVAFSPDGRLVAAGSLDRIVRVWDAQTGYFLERYEGHTDSVYSVAFSPDGKSLASGSLDKTLKLWDLSGSRSRSRCRSTFSGHKDFVLSVAFSPDGNWLISGSKDRSVQFWDPRSSVTHMMLQGHKNSVISVAVSPAGGVFATGSGDFRARIWKYD